MHKVLRLAGRLAQPILSGENFQQNHILFTRAMSVTADYTFNTLKVSSPAEFVKNVEMNRPEKRNAMNADFWAEMVECFNRLALDHDCRVVILSGAGKMFTSGENFQQNHILFTRAMSVTADYTFNTLKVSSPAEFVKNVEMNRPEKRNAMNADFWAEMVECFNRLALDHDCRVVILSGAGKMFTSGLDVSDNGIFQKAQEIEDVGRRAFFLNRKISQFQESFSVIEKCHKPVIAAVHNACIGGGLDMISACDIRYCTQDAWFQIKEVDLGLAADVGTLQRFQKIIGNDSTFRELTYTGRKFLSDEAKSMGFVSRILLDKNEMMAAVLELAVTIASKSPIAVQGSKHNIVFSRDHSVTESLNYMANWNSAMLQSEDFLKAISALMQKQKAEFSKL